MTAYTETPFFLFIYEPYEASGGIGDYVGAYATFEDALAMTRPPVDPYKEWEIIELLDGQLRLVASRDTPAYNPDAWKERREHRRFP